MNLYVLKMEDVDWDQYRGFVVAAEDEAEARQIAQDRAENYDQDFLTDGMPATSGVPPMPSRWRPTPGCSSGTLRAEGVYT